MLSSSWVSNGTNRLSAGIIPGRKQCFLPETGIRNAFHTRPQNLIVVPVINAGVAKNFYLTGNVWLQAPARVWKSHICYPEVYKTIRRYFRRGAFMGTKHIFTPAVDG